MDINALNEKAKTYDQVLASPWNILGYAIRKHNLEKHLGKNLNILDVGGGNGEEAIALARAGHTVHILDMSEEMLKQAQAKLVRVSLANKVILHMGAVEAIPDVFEQASFDVVLGHNVLQYVPSIPKALKAVSFALKHGGFASVVCLNKYSEALRQATQLQNIPAAKEALHADSYVTAALGLPVALLTPKDISVPATETGLDLAAHYGIRCINDYVMDNATKTPESILDLELELTETYPYYLIARFFQLVFKKGVKSRA